MRGFFVRCMSGFLCAIFFCAVASAAGNAATPYETRATHDPDGIGKFYMGREIAHVMGPGGIIWLERSEREREERPQQVIEALDIREGQAVADLGAGSGYYSFRMAERVGSRGTVYAIDIEPLMLRFIRERADREGVANIKTVNSSATDPTLPSNSIDLLLMVDVYHELEHPFEVMQKVYAALRPGGRVALVEYRAEDPKVMIKAVHKMTERQIIAELKAANFRHVKTVRTLPLQHLVIFEKP
jgi:ubiquinone/menaquinone biosynthesis C-methylase UbiE